MKRNTMFTLKYEYCGFEKFWITTVKGEIGWQDQKVTMYKLTFPFLLNGRQSLKILHVSIPLRKVSHVSRPNAQRDSGKVSVRGKR